ncbi:MAG: exopolysaccharide biosynthesis protein [Hyphomonadaceae bacterium]
MDAAAASAGQDPRAPSTSELLEEVANSFPNERVSVGELLDRLEGRAIGLVLLILALPMCIPNIPGISTVFGALLLAPSLALTTGARKLWAPNFMRNWTFSREGMRRAVSAAAPVLRRVERLFRPRLTFITHFPFTILLGVQALIMAIVLIIPIPGGNWPPGMTISIMALAMMERDGLLALFSTLCTVLSGIAAYYFFRFGVFAMHELTGWVTGLFN